MGEKINEFRVDDQQIEIKHRIFNHSPVEEALFINEHSELVELIDDLRRFDQKIVLTSGTFDILHIGHAAYLNKAKSYGDFLIVGVDSDEKVRKRKGPDRPVVPESERVKMLASLRSVDFITLKQPDEPRWGLIKLIKPDTLIITEETYDDDTKLELGKICGQVICLEPQATTSTSAKIRLMEIGWGNKIKKPIEELLERHNANDELCREIGKILIGRKDD